MAVTIQFHRVVRVVKGKDCELYELDESITLNYPFPRASNVCVGCIALGPERMRLSPGYQWDGASGPTYDTANTHRATAFHDAMYTLLETGVLPRKFRRQADRIFRDMLKEDGMSFVRRCLWWRGVRMFGWWFV